MLGQRAFAKHIIRIAAACAAIVLCAFAPLPALSQTPQVRYFEETGHQVQGPFLDFYDRHGGLAILGYPLTREFQEDGRTVQYFQRFRLELASDGADSQRVLLAPLGDMLWEREPPLDESEIPPPTHLDKRYFSETGHTVSFAFLEFFDSHGGAEVFGYPISELVFEEDGRIVQLFERAKLEWYPENPAGHRVQLAMLGAMWVEQEVDPEYTRRESVYAPPASSTSEPEPEPVGAARSPVSDLRLTATLKHAIIGLEQTQTAYIYVFDQDHLAVPGATVELSVMVGDEQQALRTASTNDHGYCQIEFDVQDPAPGYVVIVHVLVLYQDLSKSSTVAFLPWW